MSQEHNLNIHMYKFEELLGLFDLSYDISFEDMKRAKKKVLMSHPDKSKLDPKYFLFYKKAFDLVVNFYENQNKQKKSLPNEKVDYSPMSNNLNKQTTKEVSNIINGMDKKKFNSQFNELFDKNMTKKIDESRNEWFTSEKSSYEINEKINSKNMSSAIENVKQQQQQVVRYAGVQDLYINSESGNKLYDDEDDDGSYVTSDPFSKLKFDDLRKVHKEQTVINVSEKDYNNVKQYSSVDHMMQDRGRQDLTPLEKQQAEFILAKKNKQYREQIMRKEYEEQLKVMKNEQKNKDIISKFLFIKN
jgi:hypothetical protein